MYWNTVKEFFDFLNSRIAYAVLRNGEEISRDGFVTSGQDIDLICENKNKFMKLCGNTKWANRLTINNNIVVMIQGEKIPIDIYQPGDGYYDVEWEKEMLKARYLTENGIYILSEEDLFFSTAYHALYHKDTFKKKYREKLQNMTVMEWDGEAALRRDLEDFMKKNNYKYTYPSVPSYINLTGIESGRIYKSFFVPINKEIEKVQFVLQRIARCKNKLKKKYINRGQV